MDDEVKVQAGAGAAWSLEHWKPSALPESSWLSPTPEAADQAGLTIHTRTRNLVEQPYHPSHWLVRAKALLVLGFPELATGDAYKALLLCDSGTDNNQELAEKVKSVRGVHLERFQNKSYAKTRKHLENQLKTAQSFTLTIAAIRQEVVFVLITALDQTTSYHDAFDQCRVAIAMYPLDQRFIECAKRLATCCLKEDAHKGGVLATKYPWMAFEHQQRSATALASAIAHIRGISGNSCTLSESTLVGQRRALSRHVKWLDHDQTKPFTITGKAVPKTFLPAKDFDKKAKLATKVSAPESDFIGVFAARDIPAYTLLLRDVTVTGAASVQFADTCSNCFANLDRTYLTVPCCEARFCDTLCRDLALASYHMPLCANNSLRWVFDDAASHRSGHPHPLLLLRFLATAVHENTHPLSHEFAAVLTGNYTGKHIASFTFQENIVQPIRMLQGLNVDVFADARFETWVVFTLQHRITINKRAEPYAHGGYMLAVNPCFSMFNHSCDANAMWTDGGSSTVEVRTKKDVKKGEEIFLNYGGEGYWLKHWFGVKGCRCSKCLIHGADESEVGIAV